MDGYTLFEINILHQPKGYDHYPVVIEFAEPDNVVVTQAQGQILLDDNHASLLQEHENWGEPDKYGQTLGSLLFQGTVHEAFIKAGTQKRIFLSVDAPELRGLRWERLATPSENGDWQMLARNENTPFAITLASNRHVVFPPLQQDEIKALVIVSHPQDLEANGFSSFDAEKGIKDAIVSLSHITSEIDVLAIEAQAGIDAALEMLEQARRRAAASEADEPTMETDMLMPTVTHLGKPTEDALSTALTTKAYTILHLMAHGNFISQNGQDETYVYLANNEDDKTEKVSATNLIGLLKDKHAVNLPRFAFLVSCASGRSTRAPYTLAAAGREGLGQRLVQEAGLQAVVAMMDEITVATAEQLAPTFYERLSEHGYPDLALVQAGAGLRRRVDMEEIVPVLFSRLRGRPLYYCQYLETAGVPLEPAQIESGFKHLRQLIEDRAPGLMKELAKQDPDGKKESDALLELKDSFLSPQPDWPSLTNLVSDWAVIEWLNNVCYNLLDFDFVELAKGREVPLYTVECPFPGLKAFGIPTDPESKEAIAYFFGREALVERLLRLLDDDPVLVVLGDSGNGKSSAVMAGVVPKLEATGSKCQYMTPGKKPLVVLERLIHNTPDMIVVDQFEEIFTLVRTKQEDKDTRLAFIERLASWVEEPVSDRKLILTMRNDFISECRAYDKLTDWVVEHSQQVVSLTAVELRDVAWQQAMSAFPIQTEDASERRSLGLKFETGLLNTILNDLQDELGAMPLLQFTLRELWQRRTGRWLRANAYGDLGGVKRAIANTAEDVYQKLDNEEKALMKSLFIRLTHLDESGGRGQRRRDTCHRVALADLVTKGYSLEEVESLIHKPKLRGLLVTSQLDTEPSESNQTANPTKNNSNAVEINQNTEVEVIHEAVIRHWQRLQEWLDRDYEMLRQRQKIGQEALGWRREVDARKQASLLLLHGSRLQEIRAWRKENQLELNDSEEEYLNACIARERKQTRWKQVGVAVLAILFLIATALAWQARTEAIKAKALMLILGGNLEFDQYPLVGLSLIAEAAELVNLKEFSEKVDIEKIFTGREYLLSNSVHRLEFSPDGKTIYIASGEEDKYWSVSGKKFLTFPPGKFKHTFIANGKFILLKYEDRFEIFNTKDGKRPNFLPDGKIIDATPDNKYIHIELDSKDVPGTAIYNVFSEKQLNFDNKFKIGSEIVESNNGDFVIVKTVKAPINMQLYDVRSNEYLDYDIFLDISEIQVNDVKEVSFYDLDELQIIGVKYKNNQKYETRFYDIRNKSSVEFIRSSPELPELRYHGNGLLEVQLKLLNSEGAVVSVVDIGSGESPRRLESIHIDSVSSVGPYLLARNQTYPSQCSDNCPKNKDSYNGIIYDTETGNHLDFIGNSVTKIIYADKNFIFVEYLGNEEYALYDVNSGEPVMADGYKYVSHSDENLLLVLQNDSGKTVIDLRTGHVPDYFDEKFVKDVYITSGEDPIVIVTYKNDRRKVYYLGEDVLLELPGDSISDVKFERGSKLIYIKYKGAENDYKEAIYSFDSKQKIFELTSSASINIQNTYLITPESQLAIRENGSVYLLDVEWLKDMSEAPDKDLLTLVGLACKHPLEDWHPTEIEESRIKEYLEDRDELDCRSFP